MNPCKKENLSQMAETLYRTLSALDVDYPIPQRWGYDFVLDVGSLILYFSANPAGELEKMPWFDALLDKEPKLKEAIYGLFDQNAWGDVFVLATPITMMNLNHLAHKEPDPDKQESLWDLVSQTGSFLWGVSKVIDLNHTYPHISKKLALLQIQLQETARGIVPAEEIE